MISGVDLDQLESLTGITSDSDTDKFAGVPCRPSLFVFLRIFFYYFFALDTRAPERRTGESRVKPVVGVIKQQKYGDSYSPRGGQYVSLVGRRQLGGTYMSGCESQFMALWSVLGSRVWHTCWEKEESQAGNSSTRTPPRSQMAHSRLVPASTSECSLFVRTDPRQWILLRG